MAKYETVSQIITERDALADKLATVERERDEAKEIARKNAQAWRRADQDRVELHALAEEQKARWSVAESEKTAYEVRAESAERALADLNDKSVAHEKDIISDAADREAERVARWLDKHAKEWSDTAAHIVLASVAADIRSHAHRNEGGERE